MVFPPGSPKLTSSCAPSSQSSDSDLRARASMTDFVKQHFRADAFAGTAKYYRLYRPPYPQDLLDDLLQRARVSRSGNLLDLACGPGRVSLAIASSFAAVSAVDL